MEHCHVEEAIVDRIDWDIWHIARADEQGERQAIHQNMQTLAEMEWL